MFNKAFFFFKLFSFIQTYMFLWCIIVDVTLLLFKLLWNYFKKIFEHFSFSRKWKKVAYFYWNLAQFFLFKLLSRPGSNYWWKPICVVCEREKAKFLCFQHENMQDWKKKVYNKCSNIHLCRKNWKSRKYSPLTIFMQTDQKNFRLKVCLTNLCVHVSWWASEIKQQIADSRGVA